MKKGFKLLIGHIVGAILGLYLALAFIPQVSSTEKTFSLILAGTVLGLVNITLNPLLKLLTTPLRILSLGTLNLIINMIFLWGITVLFPFLHIPLVTPLLLTSLIISGLNILLSL